MKKHIFLLTLLVLSVFSIQVNAQQGKWAGTIKYQLTWTGDIPAEAQLPTEWETKVFENKTKSMSFMWAMSGLPATELTDATRKTVTFMFDFSMIPMEELNGKWFIRKKLTDEDVEDFYDMMYDPDFNHITNYISPSDEFALIQEAKEQNYNEDKFTKALAQISNIENPSEDFRNKAKKLYNKYVL